MSAIANLDRARRRIARTVLARLAPPVDASPIDGGAAAIGPLSERRATPWWTELPHGLAPLGEAALLAEFDAALAAERIESWLDADRPGEGASWADADLVAGRLVHLAVAGCRLAPNSDLARRIGGSTSAHVAWLVRNQPIDDTDPTTLLCHAALAIAALAMPALPKAHTWRNAALTGLRRSLPGSLGDDGAPRHDPPRVARALWVAALARSACTATGIAWPAEADGALLAGSDALWRMAGDRGDLPGRRPVPPAILPLGPAPLAHTLRNLVVAWGLDEAPGAQSDDPACALVAGEVPDAPVEAMAGRRWRLWTWRDTGAAVAWREVKKRPSRLWTTARDGWLDWDAGSVPIVRGALAGGAGQMTVARVDGPKMRVTHQMGHAVRDVRARQARLVVEDRGVDRLEWELGRDWAFERTEAGWTGEAESGLELIVQVDPDWTWELHPAPRAWRLVGRGTVGAKPVRSSFEVR